MIAGEIAESFVYTIVIFTDFSEFRLPSIYRKVSFAVLPKLKNIEFDLNGQSLNPFYNLYPQS